MSCEMKIVSLKKNSILRNGVLTEEMVSEMKVLGTVYLVTWCLYRRGNCTARYWSAPEIENILVTINMGSTVSFLHVAIDGNKHTVYICYVTMYGVE